MESYVVTQAFDQFFLGDHDASSFEEFDSFWATFTTSDTTLCFLEGQRFERTDPDRTVLELFAGVCYPERRFSMLLELLKMFFN